MKDRRSMPAARSPAGANADHEASALRRLHRGPDGGGSPLEPLVRRRMEEAFGRPLGEVRVHTDAAAGGLSRALDARALTWGQHVYFGPGAYAPATTAGNGLLAHEISHVLQSGPVTGRPTRVSRPDDPHERQAARSGEAVGRGVSPAGDVAVTAPEGMVHRYTSGEHPEAGMIGTYLGPEETTHRVARGELPAAIAARFGISVDALMARNRGKLRRWTTRSGGRLLGFNAGETIVVPTGRLARRTPAAIEPAKPAPQNVVIAGVTMEYGEATAMGDFYADPEAMLGAQTPEATELLRLIRQERKAPGSVQEQEWDVATGGRYMDLNLRNREHFAPAPDAGAPSAPLAGVDHHASWLRYHHQALEIARKGEPDRGLAINAFADHFLTDAFAAGHMINKQAVMDAVMRRLRTKAEKEAFAQAIANGVFADAAAAAICRQYEASFGPFWPDIDSASRFKDVLLGIDAQVPDVLPNAVAAAIHDELNTIGVEVHNAKRTWTVKGDGSMESIGLDQMRQAVAESYAQVANAAQGSRAPDLTAMDKAVWDLVPQATPAGQRAINAAVASLADPTAAATITRVTALVTRNLELLMDSAAARSQGKLRRRAAP